MEDYVMEYLRLQQGTIAGLPQHAIAGIIARFKTVLDEGRQVFVFGNGGSGSNASHFVTDLGKGASDKTTKRFRCLSLNDNTSWITALGNDYAYDDVFVRQLMNLAQPRDLVFVMSVSGNSPNLVKALEWCAQNEVDTIAMVGAKNGALAKIAGTVLTVQDTHYGRVEDAHMTICHIIAYAFMEREELQK